VNHCLAALAPRTGIVIGIDRAAGVRLVLEYRDGLVDHERGLVPVERADLFDNFEMFCAQPRDE
jgi:hypothetical protein